MPRGRGLPPGGMSALDPGVSSQLCLCSSSALPLPGFVTLKRCIHLLEPQVLAKVKILLINRAGKLKYFLRGEFQGEKKKVSFIPFVKPFQIPSGV